MDHASNAGDDHLRAETQRAEEMLQVRFVDRSGMFDEYAAEERHENAHLEFASPEDKSIQMGNAPKYFL